MSTRPRHGGVLLALALSACNTQLELPDDALVVCESDRDCPSPRTCEVAIQRCIVPGVVDTEPPTLVAATASDSNHVTLELSEAIDPRTSDLTRYAVTPSLEVTAAELSASFRQVRLTVTTQEPGRDYDVQVEGVTDLAGNAIAAGTRRTFTGFGAAPDRSPPQPIAPLAGEVIRDTSTTLVWTRRTYAQHYEVEVAYDAELTLPLPGFPRIVADPQTAITVELPEAARYYWRVRANSTLPGEYGASSFDRLGSVIHVYCAADAACVDDAASGNISAPFRTLNGAIARARATGIREIRVAARGGTAAYPERVTVTFGANLRGGYTPSFDDAGRNAALNVTTIDSADGPALLIFGVSESIVVDGFTLRSSSDDGVRVSGASDVVISGNDVAAAESAIAIESSLLDSGQTVISDNVVHSLTPRSWHGIRVSTAGATIRDNTIAIDQCTSSCKLGAAIFVEGSDVVIERNVITHGGHTGPAVGVDLEESRFDVRNNRVTMGAGATTALKTTSTFAAQQPSVVANNILLGGSTFTPVADFSTALDVQSLYTVLVANNVLYGGSGASTARAVRDQSGVATETSYVNNIMFNGDATPSYCFYETDSAHPTFFRANLLFGCPTALYRDYSSVDGERLWTTIAQVNNAANTTQGVSATAGGNLTLGSLAEVGFVAFPDDVHLTAATPVAVRRSGLNAAQALCGPSSNLGCGNVVEDYDRVTRTCPTPVTACYSLGPYERDP